MAFQLTINTDKIVSFQPAKYSGFWASSFDMKFDLPVQWSTNGCMEYIAKLVLDMGVAPYKNLASYEHHVEAAIAAMQAAANDIIDCNGEMSYTQTFGDHELSVVLRMVD